MPLLFTPAQLSQFSWEQLPASFSLETPQGTVQFNDCLRFLPHRRIAGRATWRNNSVFAKLFLRHPKRAQQEYNNLQLINQHNIAAPTPLALIPLKNAALLITEWCTAPSAKDQPLDMLLPALVSQVIALFHAGLLQTDLHLDNFLWDGQQLLLIDAGQMQPVSPHNYRALINTMAGLLVQLPLKDRADAQQFIERELTQRLKKPLSLTASFKKQHHQHVRGMMKKWRRECTLIKTARDSEGQWLIERALAADTQQLLTNAIAQRTQLPLIKRGSRVAVYRHPNGWIIKHYHSKEWRVHLKHLLFCGRADISWVMGWTLDWLGIPTPKPVMLKRFNNGEQIIVFPAITGNTLADAVTQQGASHGQQLIQRARFWLDLMHHAGFWHGDTKATNVLIDSHQETQWIDLDATGYSGSSLIAHRKALRDNARFSRNWSL